MTEVQVVWLPPSRDKWSGGLLERLFAGDVWRVPGITYRQVSQRSAAKDQPAVVVVSGEEWAPRTKVAELNRYIAKFSHVVLIVIADEGSVFPWQRVDHPSLRLWIQTPRPGVHPDTEEMFYFGFGWHADTPDVLAALPEVEREDWIFAGQITHASRRELAGVLRGMTGGTLIETEGFAQGLDRHAYLARMAGAKVIPCPSGPLTPDSFRLYEALEAGCVPIVETTCPGYESDEYWRLVYGAAADGLTPMADWSVMPEAMDGHRELWEQGSSATLSAWWQAQKRHMAWQLRDDVLGRSTPVDGITVVITASPIPSDPSLDVVAETIDSVRKHPELEDAEIVVVCDGAKEPNPDYIEHMRRLTRATEHDWPQVTVVWGWDHVHQANLTRYGLGTVRTPLVLFMEHDTPLCGDVPWRQLGDVILSGQANVIRLSSEAHILEPWKHLYLDTQDTAHDVVGVPLVRTVQWSSRPHLADTDWYRRIIETYFDPSCRTFTEDVLHGVVDHAWRTKREAGWREWRLWIYAPPGDMKRSWHTDGRAGGEKASMSFAYPGGETPPGAPRATADRAPE